MSDNQHIITNDQLLPVPAIETSAAWDRKDREHVYRANELLPANKTVLLDALSAAGITHVTIHFDGYGDEGQMEDICAKAGEASAELPEDRIEIVDPIWGSSDFERQTVTISEAIKTLSWNILRRIHGFWEDGEGGFGDLLFNVGERTIKLEYSERITDTEFHEHEF